MHYLLRTPLLRPMLFALLVCSGCSSSSTEITPAEDSKEIVAKDQKASDSPEHILLEKAKQSYQNQLYSAAKEQFTSLLNNFPTGIYADFAELKLADSSFFNQEYEISGPLYEEYSKAHPGTLNAAYALLMAARSFQLSSQGVGHDAHALERARALYTQLKSTYPDSMFGRRAGEYLTATLTDLAQNEREVAEFYRKKGMEDAYQARMKVVRERWEPLIAEAKGATPPAVVAEEIASSNTLALNTTNPEEGAALHQEPVVDDSSPEETVADESDNSVAAASAAIIDSGDSENAEKPDVPENDVREDTEAEVTESEEIKTPLAANPDQAFETQNMGNDADTASPTAIPTLTTPIEAADAMAPLKSPESTEANVPTIAPTTQPTLKASVTERAKVTEQRELQPDKMNILRVECSDENVFLYLDKPWRDRQFLKSAYLLSPNADGIIELSLPDTVAQKQIYDCFGTGDLFVSEKGAITIANKKPMFVRALNNPSKLALITKRFY